MVMLICKLHDIQNMYLTFIISHFKYTRIISQIRRINIYFVYSTSFKKKTSRLTCVKGKDQAPLNWTTVSCLFQMDDCYRSASRYDTFFCTYRIQRYKAEK